MPKVAVQQNPAPSSAPKPTPESEDTVITDAAGRKLTLRQPNILQESRLVRAMGEAAMNAAYMTGYVLPAAMVVEIDGVRCPMPSTQMQIEAAIQHVGRGGMTAIMQHITKSMDPEGEADAIKKSEGTPSSESPAG